MPSPSTRSLSRSRQRLRAALITATVPSRLGRELTRRVRGRPTPVSAPTDTVEPVVQTAMAGDELRVRAESSLRATVGSPDAVLRDDQWEAVDVLVAQQRRALVVQRTGWGKSAVYFVATVLLRARGSGPTLIVSPLLALMRNQIDAAARAGIAARTINSANLQEWDEIATEVRAGTVDLLLVSPERLNNPDFRDTLLSKETATT